MMLKGLPRVVTCEPGVERGAMGYGKEWRAAARVLDRETRVVTGAVRILNSLCDVGELSK